MREGHLGPTDAAGILPHASFPPPPPRPACTADWERPGWGGGDPLTPDPLFPVPLDIGGLEPRPQFLEVFKTRAGWGGGHDLVGCQISASNSKTEKVHLKCEGPIVFCETSGGNVFLHLHPG